MLLSLLMLGLSFSACLKKTETIRYKKGSNEYLFFKTLSEKTPILDPDKSTLLIAARNFRIESADIFPNLYAISRRNPSFFQEASREMLLNYARQIAAQEAEKKMLLLSAESNRISVHKDSVEKQLKIQFDQQGGKEAYLGLMANIGLTPKMIYRDKQNQMVRDQLIRDVIYKRIRVSEQEIRAAYDEEIYVTVRQIVAGTSGKSQQELDAIQVKMEKWIARAKKGESMAGLAEAYSEDPNARGKGGLVENIPRYALLASFEKVLFSLPVGGISDVLRSPNGMFIIQVIKRSKESKPFDQVKNSIENELLRRKQISVYTAYMDSLKTKYQYKVINL